MSTKGPRFHCESLRQSILGPMPSRTPNPAPRITRCSQSEAPSLFSIAVSGLEASEASPLQNCDGEEQRVLFGGFGDWEGLGFSVQGLGLRVWV